MIWYALLIPVFFTILSYFIIKSYDFWWEFLIPTGITFLFILISYFVIEKISMYDIEYNGYQVTEARYYEYWETYKHRTCYRTVSCGKNCKRSVPYDCSYCDKNSAYWVSVDNFGNEYRISQIKYNDLKKRWQNENFVELNRSINNWMFCGKDGDMYKTKWNGNIYHSENAVKTQSFQNKIKVSHTAFKFPDISKEKADSLGLYHYPEFKDFYKQDAILAKNFYVKDSFKILFEYLNGSMGFPHKVKTFTLIFKNSPQDIAIKQEQYWEGGNQNEIVICIGVDDRGKIEWVKPFSWCDNKRLIVELRENISELGYLDWKSMYDIYRVAISKYYHWKSFEDFNYLKFEPTAGQLWFVYIGAFIVSLLGVYITMRIE